MILDFDRLYNIPATSKEDLEQIKRGILAMADIPEHYMDTQPIDLCDMPTLQLAAILSTDDTIKTPIPSLPEEVACGPGWQLYQYRDSYGLVLHTITESLAFAFESSHLKLLGFDIHLRYRKLEER